MIMENNNDINMNDIYECKVIKDYGCVDGLCDSDRLVLLQLSWPSTFKDSYLLYTKHYEDAFVSCPCEEDFDKNEFSTVLCRLYLNYTPDYPRIKCLNEKNDTIEELYMEENYDIVEYEDTDKEYMEQKKKDKQIFSDIYDNYMESIHTNYVLK